MCTDFNLCALKIIEPRHLLKSIITSIHIRKPPLSSHDFKTADVDYNNKNINRRHLIINFDLIIMFHICNFVLELRSTLCKRCVKIIYYIVYL